MGLAKRVYEITAGFPRDERYGFTSQVRRSAVSIPSNIAEGNVRMSTRDYARFIAVALGSTAELQTQLLLSRDLGLGASAPIDEARSEEHTSELQSLMRISYAVFCLKKKKKHININKINIYITEP